MYHANINIVYFATLCSHLTVFHTIFALWLHSTYFSSRIIYSQQKSFFWEDNMDSSAGWIGVRRN